MDKYIFDDIVYEDLDIYNTIIKGGKYERGNKTIFKSS